MHSFTDTKNREWKIEINIGSARRAKNLIDLIDGRPEELVEVLSSRPLLRVDLLWEFCINKNDVSREDFEDCLVGATLLSADKVLWEEIGFFIQTLRPELAGLMPRLLQRIQKLVKRQMEAVIKFSESPEFEKMTDEKLEGLRKQALAEAFSTSQES